MLNLQLIKCLKNLLNLLIAELEAQRIIAKSTINKMLKKSPEFIMHYSIEDNAKEIYDEYMGIPLEM